MAERARTRFLAIDWQEIAIMPLLTALLYYIYIYIDECGRESIYIHSTNTEESSGKIITVMYDRDREAVVTLRTHCVWITVSGLFTYIKYNTC